MATKRRLAELFRAVAAEDIGRASAVAAQICAEEEQKGHREAARLLRGSLHANGGALRKPDFARVAETLNGTSVISSALVRLADDVTLKDVVLSALAKKELLTVIREWQKRDRLDKYGLAPRTKLIFHGPPGCGKSLTARALAHELKLPVYLVRFDAVIGAYLGQTAIHLRQLFHFAETAPCVLLLDELDALGKRRGNPLDVGELDRIVIALMQELEHAKPMGLIIGTSNLPKHLDGALWRRFDLAVSFRCPTKPTLSRFANHVAASREIILPVGVARRAAAAKTFANAEAIVVAEARRQAIGSD
jgi:AAA+ superfamily predicted ATPase